MTKKRSPKIQVSILPTLEQMIIGVAMREYKGNVSNYVRELIIKDMILRNSLDQMAAQVMREQQGDE